MARFDVFANPTAVERKHTPYFIDVQNDFIDQGLFTLWAATHLSFMV